MESETALQISMLGELTLSRAGRRLELPPSRKTRALLAYLVLTGRSHRRERLSAVFWDVADDPRGALRWSLSKLRGLVDEPGCTRIEADRESVRFEPNACRIDVLELRAQLAKADLDGIPVESLEQWAARFRGELLEGLDLGEFDEYQAFCVAEREQVRQMRARILASLTERLRGEPGRALSHARAWVHADPLDEVARVSLLRTALEAGRPDEAAQHYESGKRLLEELGSSRLDTLHEAWRELSRGASRPHVPEVAATREPAPVAQSLQSSAPSPGFVGRDAEFSRLKALLEQVASESKAQLVAISGEPGIGKTHLSAELQRCARERGASVLYGAAYESETGRPYGAWIDALRDAESTPQAFVSTVQPQTADGSSDGGGRERLFASISGLLSQRAAERPAVLVVLDDAHWLDRASCELLHYVVRTHAAQPVLFALTTRPVELADNTTLTRVLQALRRERTVQDLPLTPFTEDAIGALLATVDSALTAERIFEQSGGNPLFALELARGGDAMATSAADAVRDRIDRLVPRSVDVLRWGAVLGCTFNAARLEMLMAMPIAEVVEALEHLERHSLIRATASRGQSGGYLFAHEVVQRVVYADLSQPRRELMHRRVAEALRQGEELDGNLAAEIAHHATLGHADDLASMACARAAQHCLRLFAYEDAASLVRRGRRHAERLEGPERVQRLIELCEVQVTASRGADVEPLWRLLETLAEEALDLGLNEHARAAFYLLSFLDWEGGDYRQARERTMQAVVASRGADGAERVRGMANAARCLVLLERDLPDAHAMLLEAQARGRALNLEPVTLLDGLGMVALHQGKLEQARELFERARMQARAARDRLYEFYALEHLATVQLECRDYGALKTTASAMLEIAERMPEGSEGALSRVLGALAAHGSGADASAELDAGFEALRAADAKQRLAHCLCHAALIDLERGDASSSLARGQEALGLAQTLERPTETLLARMLIARVSRDLDDHGVLRVQREAIAGRSWQDASILARRRHLELLGTPLAEPSVQEATWS